MSQAAIVWAQQFHGKNATIFKMLKVGDTFYFPSNQKKQPCIKINNTKYELIANGRTFSTGQNTAVIKVMKDIKQIIKESYSFKNFPWKEAIHDIGGKNIWTDKKGNINFYLNDTEYTIYDNGGEINMEKNVKLIGSIPYSMRVIDEEAIKYVTEALQMNIKNLSKATKDTRVVLPKL